MKKDLFKILLCIITINSFSQVSIPPDSSFYYNENGTKNWWYLQKDVFLYRMTSGTCYTMATNPTIDECKHLFATNRKQNRIKFSAAATPMQKAIIINSIGTTTGFESASPAVSKTKNVPYTAGTFNETNDLILVRFTPTALNTATALTAFMTRNNLSLYHQPLSSLPFPKKWTYIFKINLDPKNKPYGDVFTVAQYVFTNEVGFVLSCEPDMNMYVTSGSCEQVTEYANNTASGTPDGLWHIRNQGQTAYNTFVGTAGSDAKICECWGEGYHGENVKVAVIDNYGYDFSHPEMQGQFLNGWDYVSNGPTGVAITTTTYVSNNSHGMEVASVIAAKANNNSTYNTVGVAYNSRILPYLFDGTNSTAIQCIQKAVVDGADILNMSFASSVAQPTVFQSPLFNDLKNAKQFGRGGLGCFLVAGVGNNNVNGKFFPAADTIVFGVGATDASDYRAVTPTWGWSGGSNYLTPIPGEPARYNVVAPGTRIYNAFTQTPLTSPTYVQAQTNGTSFSTPIVSGIAAILLSKNSSLTVSQIEAAIQNNTDQVTTAGSYNAYSYLPGYNPNLFYGRVNCIKALTTVAVGIKEYSKSNVGLEFVRLSEKEIGIFFNKGFNDKGSIISVYDVAGKRLLKIDIEPNASSYMLSTENYLQGMYIITVTNKIEQNGQAYKFIK